MIPIWIPYVPMPQYKLFWSPWNIISCFDPHMEQYEFFTYVPMKQHKMFWSHMKQYEFLTHVPMKQYKLFWPSWSIISCVDSNEPVRLDYGPYVEVWIVWPLWSNLPFPRSCFLKSKWSESNWINMQSMVTSFVLCRNHWSGLTGTSL